jgi:hypothetical protein
MSEQPENASNDSKAQVPKEVIVYGDGEGLDQEVLSARTGCWPTSPRNREGPTEGPTRMIYCLHL